MKMLSGLTASIKKRPDKYVVCQGVLIRAEDTGLEPATDKSATDFESVCLPIRLSSGLDAGDRWIVGYLCQAC